MSADIEEWNLWLAEAALRKEHRRGSGGRDLAGYAAQLADLQRVADEKEAAAIEKQKQRAAAEAEKAAARLVKAAVVRSKDLVNRLRFKEFKILALKALNLSSSGDVGELTLRLYGANLSLLEDVCPRLHVLALEKAGGSIPIPRAEASSSGSATRPRSTSPPRPVPDPAASEIPSPSQPPPAKLSKRGGASSSRRKL